MFTQKFLTLQCNYGTNTNEVITSNNSIKSNPFIKVNNTYTDKTFNRTLLPINIAINNHISNMLT